MTTIYNILKLKNRRIELRRAQTQEEAILWSRLRKNQLGFKFRRQHSIGGYIVDFYCPKKKLVIEIDGPLHFKKENKKYDKVRSDYFLGLDIKVLRFKNIEVSTETERIVRKIKSALTTP